MADSIPGPLPQKSGALPMSHRTSTNEPPHYYCPVFKLSINPTKITNSFCKMLRMFPEFLANMSHFYEENTRNRNLCELDSHNSKAGLATVCFIIATTRQWDTYSLKYEKCFPSESKWSLDTIRVHCTVLSSTVTCDRRQFFGLETLLCKLSQQLSRVPSSV